MATKAKQTKETKETSADVRLDLLQGLLTQVSLNDIYKSNYGRIRDNVLDAYPELKYVYEVSEFILDKLSGGTKEEFVNNPEYALLSVTSVSVSTGDKLFNMEFKDSLLKLSATFSDDILDNRSLFSESKWLRTVHLRSLHADIAEFLDNCKNMIRASNPTQPIKVSLTLSSLCTVEYEFDN